MTAMRLIVNNHAVEKCENISKLVFTLYSWVYVLCNEVIRIYYWASDLVSAAKAQSGQ